LEEQTNVALYLLDLLGLKQLASQSFIRISSGEQRRLLLARALVKNPPLLILDEPFHGLDEVNKRLCLNLVESYCAQPGKTLIYVTHHEEEIPKSVNNTFKLGKYWKLNAADL
jgi:molybdate transport system ATP-binding protein